ncbi:hypothetical protein [Methylorubrum thiocyanatum]|uniref:hypothetical protein n=1 Tax=Methylorubrum thiocyanatum TaxID=47958 RepID=UPI00365665C1
MAHNINYHEENYEDLTHQFGGAWTSLSHSMTDLRFHEELARLDPAKFARALMPEPMRDWLSANVLPSDYSLRMEQQRHDPHRYTRRAWIEFRHNSDAVLFKLTWGGTNF